MIAFIYFYTGIFAFYLCLTLFKKKWFSRGASVISLLGLAAMLLIYLIRRSLAISFVALTGTYESLLFYSLVIFVLGGFFILQKGNAYPSLLFFITLSGLTFLLIASSPLVHKDLQPPIPALRSAWLLLHVSFAFIGYAFFVFSFIASILVLAARSKESQISLDGLSYNAVVAGYAFFTLGALIFGAIWAEASWGSFWSWDPKETWALVTWIVYSLYLHLRLYRKKWINQRAWVSILGFICTLITFLGVNYLANNSLHSYQ